MHSWLIISSTFILWSVLFQHGLAENLGALFGFKTLRGAYLSCSGAVAHNGVTLQNNFEWVRKVGDSFVGIHGDLSDCEELFQLLSAQSQSYELEFSKPMPTKSIAHLCRSIISDRLRTQTRLSVCAMVSGCDGIHNFDGMLDQKVPCLYWLDDLGSLKEVSYAAHGRDTPFLLSILDTSCDMKGVITTSSAASEVSESAADGLVKCGQDDAKKDERGQEEEEEDVQSAVTTARECWEQLSKRSRARVDVKTTKLYCTLPSSSFAMKLTTRGRKSRRK